MLMPNESSESTSKDSNQTDNVDKVFSLEEREVENSFPLSFTVGSGSLTKDGLKQKQNGYLNNLFHINKTSFD